MPTTGRWSRSEPVEPWNAADPKVKMPPSDPTSQYPCDGGGGGGDGGGGGGGGGTDGAFTIRVKTCVAAGPTPSAALRQTVKVPPSPGWGVPWSVAVEPPV